MRKKTCIVNVVVVGREGRERKRFAYLRGRSDGNMREQAHDRSIS